MKSRPAPCSCFHQRPIEKHGPEFRLDWSCRELVSTHSATKSAKTWDLMAFRGVNEIVSPMISTAHFATLPEASRH
jgi:hypothetical protein